MDISKIKKSLENCPCGQKHDAPLRRVEIGHGLTSETGKILKEEGFGRRLLLVADKNTLKSSPGIRESLENAGFELKMLIYPDMKYARAENTVEIESLLGDVDGIISVGSGSLNDICRVPAARLAMPFCIFATAPSMDGFASGTSPILRNNYKETWQAEQPLVIIGDTAILAKAPVELKAAGLGDMIAKYIAICDWKISSLLTGEIFCENIVRLTLDAVNRCVELADLIPTENEEAAGAVMEALVISGLAMRFAGCSRPASGAEHMISHYLEDYKCLRGIWPEYHGKKVGVATLIAARIYRDIAENVPSVDATDDPFDKEKLLARFDPQFRDDIAKLNEGPITDIVSPEIIKEKWPLVREAVMKYVPDPDFLEARLRAAGGAVSIGDVHVHEELMYNALELHSYMRHRIFLTRLLPMCGLADYRKYGLK